jgi:ATP-binding cassette, subfamily B (MDR/TAP), member 7
LAAAAADSVSSDTAAKDVMITSDGGSSGNHPTSSLSSSSDWRSFMKLSQYVWPSSSSTTGSDNDEYKKDDHHRHIKTRVVASLGLMVAGKAVTIQIPFVFKHLVDTLPLAAATATSTGSLSTTTLFATAAVDPVQWALVSTLAMYGISRAAATGLQEYRNVVFAVVAQDAIRTVGRRVFDHLLSDLDLSYHISRSTGQLARVLDRGQRSINFVLNAMVFHIGPTILEVSLVTGLVLYQFGWAQASVVVTTVVAYTAFTFASNER